MREQVQRHQQDKESWEAVRSDLECRLRESNREASRRAASAEQAAKAMSELFERETARLLQQLDESERRRRAAEHRIMELDAQLSAAIRKDQERKLSSSAELASRNREIASLRTSLDQALSALARFAILVYLLWYIDLGSCIFEALINSLFTKSMGRGWSGRRRRIFADSPSSRLDRAQASSSCMSRCVDTEVTKR